MADSEFEEFRQSFERLPPNNRAPAPFYSLVHDVFMDDESPTSSRSDPDNDCDNGIERAPHSNSIAHGSAGSAGQPIAGGSLDHFHQHGVGEDRLGPFGPPPAAGTSRSSTVPWLGPGERKRRKLPEIPKNKKPAIISLFNNTHHHHNNTLSRELSLADELTSAGSGPSSSSSAITQAPLLTLKCGYLLWDDHESPDGADSGHSTAHSPTTDGGAKSLSPVLGMSASSSGGRPVLTGGGECNSLAGSSASGGSSNGGGVPYPDVDMLEDTHRGLHKFVPRHADEIEVEIGDPIYVQKEADDLWCEGVNLRTGRLGVFPSAYAVDSDLSDWDAAAGEHGRRERYLLGYLGSVETWAHKGTSVVCQAVRRVVGNNGGAASKDEEEPHPCILEVSDQGLRMVDRRKRNVNDPCIDYFYSLKNVSFCAFHPRDHRYLGFITKHPTLQRFACHVFRGRDSTRPVAEGVGRAFQRFYQKFIETAYPIEDIYIE